MSSIPVPDEHTYFSSRRQDDVDALAWPVFSPHALELLASAGEVLHPEPGEVLWEAGDPYDLHLVLAGEVLLVDRRDERRLDRQIGSDEQQPDRAVHFRQRRG